MTQQLKAGTTLAEDLGSVPGIHMVAHNFYHLLFPVPESPTPHQVSEILQGESYVVVSHPFDL